jgi:arginyl-tRNA synthetase
VTQPIEPVAAAGALGLGVGHSAAGHPAAGHPAAIRTQVREAIARAWARAIGSGALPPLPHGVEVAVEVERPANPEHGDFATNLGMKLARHYRQPPLRIAEAIVSELTAEATGAAAVTPIASAVAVAPGFVNVVLSRRALETALDAILADPGAWGRVRAAVPQRVNVEFVSANPTGPLHIGNARGAFVGDLLSRVLEAAGHLVTREYYFNDFGAQVRNLGASVWALANGEPVPDDGYHGEYVHDLARELPADVADAARGTDDPGWTVGAWASERVRAGIEASLAHLGVRFDVWRTEGSLHRDGWVERAIEKLRASGHIYELEGATWFRSTDFGDDKDRVIRKSNGDYTYFGSDLGYVEEKFSRGFDHLIYVWGADHHGTVARLRNAAEAMGYDRSRVEMLLMAWVRFVRDGEEISMSKRSGEFITLDELLAEVGVDAAPWFFASRAASSGIDFDIELAKTQSNENPVYYVQYAHARIAAILRKAAEAGLSRAGTLAGTGALAEGPEGLLARAVVRLPEVVEDAAAAEETQGITAYAIELATTFHAFYRDARVVDPSEPERSARRLALVEATQRTLANALGLLGISAPESM